MNEKLLIDTIIQWNFSEEEVSKTYLKAFRKKMIQKLKNKNNYLSYEFHNRKIEKLVLAEFSNTPFELDRINILCFHFSDQKSIKKELISLREFFKPKKLKIVLSVQHHQKKMQALLKRMGFLSNGIRLKASTSDSYNTMINMKITNLPKEYSIRLMNFKQDIDKVMSIELRAHKNEPSSVVHKLPKKHWEFFRKLLRGLSKKKYTFILEYKRKPIGFIAYNKCKEYNGNGIITTISLDPKFKGKGLSKYLYLKLLQEFKSKRIKKYYGYSKTEQVLKFSKKLKRKPSVYSFVLGKDKLSII